MTLQVRLPLENINLGNQKQNVRALTLKSITFYLSWCTLFIILSRSNECSDIFIMIKTLLTTLVAKRPSVVSKISERFCLHRQTRLRTENTHFCYLWWKQLLFAVYLYNFMTSLLSTDFVNYYWPSELVVFTIYFVDFYQPIFTFYFQPFISNFWKVIILPV